MSVAVWLTCCVSVCQVCLLLLSAQLLSLSGDTFIKAALRLDNEIQLQIYDLLTGLQEPRSLVTGDVISNLLNMQRRIGMHL